MGTGRQSDKREPGVCDLVDAGGLPGIPSLTNWPNGGLVGGRSAHGGDGRHLLRRGLPGMNVKMREGVESGVNQKEKRIQVR